MRVRRIQCVSCERLFPEEDIRFREGLCICPKCLKILGAVEVYVDSDMDPDFLVGPEPSDSVLPPEDDSQEQGPAVFNE